MTAKTKPSYALNKKFIEHWLIDNDATQVELADAIGVSPVVFSRYLNGRRGVPVSVLFSLAEEMRADLRELVEKVDDDEE